MVLIAPLKIGVSFSKRKGKHRYFTLNLNQYRNKNFHILNKAKVEFKEKMRGQICLLPMLSHIEITYTLYPPTKGALDISNVCSIVDKFFCDALVEFGKLPDDNWKHIPAVNYRFGSPNKDNPRIEIKIRNLETNQLVELLSIQEENEMKFDLNETELNEAVASYGRSKGWIRLSDEVQVEFKAGRKGNGFSASVTTTEGAKTSGVSATRSVDREVAEPIPASVKPEQISERADAKETKAEVEDRAEATEDKVEQADLKQETKATEKPFFGEPEEVNTKASAGSIFGEE